MLKADEGKRTAFVAEYATLWEECQETGARIFSSDEAHFRVDAELQGKWVLNGEPGLVESTSPKYGEKAGYYSVVCLETGEVEWLELEGNSNSETSIAFLKQLREHLKTADLNLWLLNLPGYSPDFNGDEAIWGWAREEATGNLCLGSRAAVQDRVGRFPAGLSHRKAQIRRRSRTVLQSRAEAFRQKSQSAPSQPNAHPTVALV